MIELTISHFVVPFELIDIVDILQIHRQALDTIRNLGRYRADFQATGLLKVGKLSYLQSVQPNFPTNTPGAKRWRSPVVFDKTDIVLQWIDTELPQTIQIHFLNIGGGRL